MLNAKSLVLCWGVAVSAPDLMYPQSSGMYDQGSGGMYPSASGFSTGSAGGYPADPFMQQPGSSVPSSTARFEIEGSHDRHEGDEEGDAEKLKSVKREMLDRRCSTVQKVAGGISVVIGVFAAVVACYASLKGGTSKKDTPNAREGERGEIGDIGNETKIPPINDKNDNLWKPFVDAWEE